MKKIAVILTVARSASLGFCVLFLMAATSLWAQPITVTGYNIQPGDDIYADSARYYLEYFESRLSRILDYKLDTVVTLYLAATETEFHRESRITPPDWGAGLANLSACRIVIKSPKYMAVEKSFRELIGHELAHIMLHRAAGGRWLPRWMQEGFAMTQSGEWRLGYDLSVARAAWTGRLIPLHQMEDLLAFKGIQAQLAYSETYLAMSRLLRQSDPYVLADLLAMYRKNGDFYGSWKSTIGVDYNSWTATWLNTVSRQYHFLIFIWDSEMFWIILAIVFILIFVWKKRQSARIRKRWEREERIRPPDDSYKQYYDGYYDEEDKV